MRNRDAVIRKIENVESSLNKIVMLLNRGDREMCYEMIEGIREQLAQLSTYIESEPIDGHELNRF